MNQRYTITYRTWFLPRMGEAITSYDDACSPPLPFSGLKTRTVRFASADGVSGAYISRRWAQLLVSAYTAEGESLINPKKLRELADRWESEERKRIDAIRGDKFIQGILRKKLKQLGGSATFVGLELSLQSGEWKSIAVGDACMFQIRNKEIIRQNPCIPAGSFTNVPNQISTLEIENEQLLEVKEYDKMSGTFTKDDIFMLATDALAEWLVTEDPENSFGKKLALLCSIQTQEQFQQIIDAERQSRRLENDDITLQILKISGSPIFLDIKAMIHSLLGNKKQKTRGRWKFWLDNADEGGCTPW